jgi:hypothetical protein
VDDPPSGNSPSGPAGQQPIDVQRKARRRRSPQDDKALSYAKDRRNNYGENHKSSLRNIALRKRLRLRAERHRVRQALGTARGRPNAARNQQVDEQSNLRSNPKAATFRKQPDRPLGDDVIARLQRRADEGIANPDVIAEKISRIRRRQR